MGARGKGVVSPVSDTRELLREVGASARESYYRRSASRSLLFVVLIIILLAIAVAGLRYGSLLGIVFASGAALGLAMVIVWMYLH
jgi:hypothetical protein